MDHAEAEDQEADLVAEAVASVEALAADLVADIAADSVDLVDLIFTAVGITDLITEEVTTDTAEAVVLAVLCLCS